MTPDLSHRLGDALGQHTVTVDERETVSTATLTAETWDDLPGQVQALVVEIEDRPGWLDTLPTTAALWNFHLPGKHDQSIRGFGSTG